MMKYDIKSLISLATLASIVALLIIASTTLQADMHEHNFGYNEISKSYEFQDRDGLWHTVTVANVQYDMADSLCSVYHTGKVAEVKD